MIHRTGFSKASLLHLNQLVQLEFLFVPVMNQLIDILIKFDNENTSKAQGKFSKIGHAHFMQNKLVPDHQNRLRARL